MTRRNHSDQPCNPEAERAIIGKVLHTPAAIKEIHHFLKPEHFVDPRHGVVFKVMVHLADSSIEPDLQAVHVALRERGASEIKASDLVDWERPVATAADIEHHARIVLEKALAREVAEVGRQIAGWASSGEIASDVAVARGEEALSRLRMRQLEYQNSTPAGFSLADAKSVVGAVRWLWPGWIPMGFVTLLAGQPEKGKSKLALRIVASSLFPDVDWPDGQSAAGGADSGSSVCWIDTEGSQAITVERAEVLKLPQDRIRWPANPRQPKETLSDLRLDDREVFDSVVGWLRIVKPPLVIIDSLRGAFSGDENSSREVLLLSRLANLARDLRCAILIVHHLNKAKEGQPANVVEIDRIRGSSAIVQFCRSVIGLDEPDPGRPGAVRMRSLKCNLAPKPLPLGFVHDGPATLKFTVRAPEVPKKETQLMRARHLVDALLEKGPMRTMDLRENARDAGVGWRTVQRLQREGRCPESCGICPTRSPEWVLRCLPGTRSFVLGRFSTSIPMLVA